MPLPPPPLSMIRELIALPSVSSLAGDQDQGNRAVIDRLAGWLADLGFSIEVMPLPHHPDKANLIATLGSGPGGLVLSGHTDTVPCDPDLWRHDPFGAVLADERVYGLGSADMKSFLALAVEAARGLRAEELSAPLIILATSDEESGMEGAYALIDAGRPKARYAVIGEPTGLRPVRAHKGVMMESIRIRGRSGHSSDPSLGASALEGMHRAIGALLSWRDELQQRYRNPAFGVPVPTLNLGHIHGGDNPNRICGHCELMIDIRPLPGMLGLEELRSAMTERLRDALGDTALELSVEALIPGLPPFETPAHAELTRACEQLTGHSAQAVAFGTEAPLLGALGMECLVLGPGHIDQAHQPDEYLELAMLGPTVELLRRLIDRYCRPPTPATRP